MKPFDYAIAENKQGALAALQQGYRILAGGVDIADLQKERIETSERYVSLKHLKELKQIEADGTGITLGARVTLAEIAASPLVQERFPALAHTASTTASSAVRARATLAGNILQRPRCWYFRSDRFPCLKKGGQQCYAWAGENTYHAIFPAGPCRITHPSSLAPLLVAAEAVMMAEDAAGETTFKASDFFLNTDSSVQKENRLKPEQLITRIEIKADVRQSGHEEIKERALYDWPAASCAAVRHPEGWRVVLGHVAPLPWTAKAAESLLGHTEDIDETLAARAADAAVSDAQPMSQNAYRVALTRAAVRRALLRACGKEPT
jgi:xanthine dehydrogenase YagS FAD-binding subunit